MCTVLQCLLQMFGCCTYVKSLKIHVILRERTIIGSVSYRNRYWVYRIESYRLLLYRPILRASLQVQHELLTGRIKQQIKGHSRRSPAVRVARARGRPPRAEVLYDPGYGRGLEGWGERDCNLIPASPWHRNLEAQYWQPATDDVAPSLSPPAGSDNNCFNCQSY